MCPFTNLVFLLNSTLRTILTTLVEQNYTVKTHYRVYKTGVKTIYFEYYYKEDVRRIYNKMNDRLHFSSNGMKLFVVERNTLNKLNI